MVLPCSPGYLPYVEPVRAELPNQGPVLAVEVQDIRSKVDEIPLRQLQVEADPFYALLLS